MYIGDFDSKWQQVHKGHAIFILLRSSLIAFLNAENTLGINDCKKRLWPIAEHFCQYIHIGYFDGFKMVAGSQRSHICIFAQVFL